MNKSRTDLKCDGHVCNDAELRALYDEGQTSKAASAGMSELTELKSRLTQLVNEPLSDIQREKFRSAILNDMQRDKSDPGISTSMAVADLVPVQGTVWIRRARSHANVPCNSVQQLNEGCVVIVPADSRAQVHYGDGSLLLLGNDTKLTVFPKKSNANRPAATLDSGQLFAWVAKQTGGRFELGTPGGNVTVLGTEFDLRHRNDETRIVIAEGKVKFTGSYADKIDVTLTAGHMLSVHASTSAQPSVERRTLKPDELRRAIAWTRGANNPAASSLRGQVLIKSLVVVAILGLLAAWYFMAGGTPSTSTQPSVASASSAAVQSAKQLAPSVTPSVAQPAPGKEQIITAEIRMKQGNDWLPGEKVKVSQRVVETKADGAQVIEVALDSFKPPAGANRIGNTSRLEDKPIRLTVHPDGQISDIRLPTAESREAQAAFMYIEMIRHTWMLHVPAMGADVSPGPGQQWQRKANGSLPNFPGTTYTFTSNVRFEGETTNAEGKKVRRFTYKGDGVLAGGIVLSEEMRGGRGRKLSLGEFRTEDSGTYDRDQQTGSVSGQLDQRKVTTIVQTTTAPNQQPFSRNLPPTVTEAKITMATETR